MGKPVATVAGGICFAFPDVCLTPAPPSPTPVPIPYPNTGQLADIQNATRTVLVKGSGIVISSSTIQQTTGDEAGSQSPTKGPVTFTSYSMTVKAEGANVVRMFDVTSQNSTATGQVLGGEPTVLVGD